MKHSNSREGPAHLIFLALAVVGHLDVRHRRIKCKYPACNAPTSSFGKRYSTSNRVRLDPEASGSGVKREHRRPTYCPACTDDTSVHSLRRARKCSIATTRSTFCRAASASAFNGGPKTRIESRLLGATHLPLMPPSPESPSFCQFSCQLEKMRAPGNGGKAGWPAQFSTIILTASSSLSTDGSEGVVSFSQVGCPTTSVGCAAVAGWPSVLEAIMDSKFVWLVVGNH